MKLNLPYGKTILALVLFFILVLIFLPPALSTFDMQCWNRWAIDISLHGVGKIYNTTANYPPVMMYILYLHNFIQGAEGITENLNFIKIFPFIFDLLPVVILILLKKAGDLKKGYYFLLIFNLAYLYNSLIWGQVDSIHSNLVLAAFFLGLRFPVAASAVFVLALNMKLQAIIFFPVFLFSIFSKINTTKSFVSCILAALITQLTLLIPFLLSHTVHGLWTVIKHASSYAPVTSLNAFNLWHLVLKTDPIRTSDAFVFCGLSYKSLGLLMFCFFSGLALVPLLVKTAHLILFKKRQRYYEELIFLTAGTITLVFFFFNTEMHERYSHPAMIFFFFYGIYKRNFLLYGLVSVAYLLNMEKVLQYFNMPHDTFIFNPRFIAWIFLGTTVLALFSLYRNYTLKDDIRSLKARIT